MNNLIPAYAGTPGLQTNQWDSPVRDYVYLVEKGITQGGKRGRQMVATGVSFLAAETTYRMTGGSFWGAAAAGVLCYILLK